MLSSAIVVFREVFEIVLIAGIVLAATRSMPHRGKAVFLGFAGGIAGSALIALFTGRISSMAEGLGQEYFNAGILFAAAAFIGWTVLWMKRHAREIKGRFQQLGQNVTDGTVSYFALSMVIAVTMLREGSEIVLFTYGMLASGQSLATILAGATIGLIGGVATGLMLYMGLIRISIKYFFRITSTLLIMLVAGMMSQGIGFLTAAGVFESLSFTVWDTSSILGEDGLLGQSLKTLLGYTAQPSAIQIIVYTLTMGLLFMLMNFFGKPAASSVNQARMTACILTALGLSLLPAQAHATKKVYTPYVEKGELEVEWRGGYTVDDGDNDGAWAQKLGVGYGVTDFWFTEIYGEIEREGEDGADTELTEVEWENKFQLTQPGEHWVDVGALVELVHNTSGGADKAEAKLLLAKDTGKFSHNLNLIAEREFGEDASDETEAGFAWNSRYRLDPAFEPGFEIYSNFGDLSESTDFDDEDHRAGPVIQGQIGHVKYDVGYLFGVTDGAPDGTAKAILEYEWRF